MDAIIGWLTGHDAAGLQAVLDSRADVRRVFAEAHGPTRRAMW